MMDRVGADDISDKPYSHCSNDMSAFSVPTEGNLLNLLIKKEVNKKVNKKVDLIYETHVTDGERCSTAVYSETVNSSGHSRYRECDSRELHFG